MPLIGLTNLASSSSWNSHGTGTSYDWQNKCGVRTCLKCIEVVLHGINFGVICPALLICAAVSVSYINKVGDHVDDYGGQLVITGSVEVGKDYIYGLFYRTEYTTVTKEYGEFDTSGSRGAAGWTLFVACASLIFHSYLIKVLIRCKEFDLEEHNTPYSVTAVVLSCLFGLSSLAGGIASLLYYRENNKLWSDACSPHGFSSTPKVCGELLVVRNTEITCAVISFVVTQVCILVVVVVIWSGILINKNRRGRAVQPAAFSNISPLACVKTEAPPGKPEKPEEPEKPEKPASVPPDMSHCDLSVPPPYEVNVSDEPPSYQSIVANS